MLRAIRLRKILPMLLICFNSSLLTSARPDLLGALLSAAFITSSSAAGMKLNVLTDRELDAATKPELYSQLTGNSAELTRALVFEVLVSVGSLIALVATQRRATSACLIVFAVAFSLYSYNFIVPSRAARWRLKVFWWGNVLTVCGGYLALWLTGLSLAPQSTETVSRHSIQLIIACVLFEYSLFLNECGTDAESEKKARLRTIPAIVGRRGTSLTAFGIWTFACALASTTLAFEPAHALPTHLVGVTAWYAGATGIVNGVFLAFTFRRHTPALWDRVVDLSFWTLRVVPSIALTAFAAGIIRAMP
jgi:4-hydroxybenzoate polyprenyltransferase